MDIFLKEIPIERNNILVIADEKSESMIVDTLLSPDYTISFAKLDMVALEQAIKEKPDLILLYIVTSDMNGFELLSTMKNISEISHIPVIIVSSFNDIDNEEKGFLLGAVDYIKIPFNTRVLKARIKTHIQIVQQFRIVEQRGIMDGLTNIPNRRYFDDRIVIEWRRALREHQPLSSLMIDIDKFKSYNDTYGHPHGDALLKAVAHVLATTVMRPTDMCARIGGEEFAVILPDTNLDGAVHVAEKLRAAVEALRVPTADGKIITTVTISLGVASLIPQENDSIEEFITRADVHLYNAKKSGRNRVSY
ncbi:MAG: diguanylate cyclase [Spirochaetaceae bacterium]|jgi:diguanylate cyclase (GGDEF)-like protein|nr:diguanylate cyclase [Spirochaetaceae bacterium]